MVLYGVHIEKQAYLLKSISRVSENMYRITVLLLLKKFVITEVSINEANKVFTYLSVDEIQLSCIIVMYQNFY